MQKITKLYGLICVCLLSGTVVASTSPVIPIDGGLISPRPGKFMFMLNQLPLGVQYTITCQIKSDNKSGQKEDMLNYSGVNYSNCLYLDGLYQCSPNFSLPTGSHTFKTEGILKGTLPTLTNLDDTDSIIVSNCVATPTTK